MFRIFVVILGMLLFAHSATAQATQCDNLAGHPDDPEGASSGVADGNISTSQAIPACQQAVSSDPGNFRYNFQLGRAFWEDDQDAKAIEKFEMAAYEGNYAAAFAYLGIAYEYGYASETPEPELARSLYDAALEGGFEPAAGLMTALSNAAPLADDDEGDPVSFASYKRSDILTPLYSEDYDALNRQSTNVILYLKGMYDFFSKPTIFEDMACAHLHDTRMTQKVLKNLLGGSSASVSGNVEGLVTRLLAELTRGGGGSALDLLENAMNMQALPEEGRRDASKLALDHQCTTDVIKTLYKNAQYFILREVRFN
ncbi:MAG: tetratricopeptide repeat protein [Hyphomicrobiales bacterium]